MGIPFDRVSNSAEEVRFRLEELRRTSGIKPTPEEEAAEALVIENQAHLVDYCMDCVNTSRNALRDVRRVQNECLSVYYEEAPPTYQRKEDWQSKVILPRPFGAVTFAQSVVRKAFDTEFMSIENEDDETSAQFWKEMLDTQLGKNHGNFATKFTDATAMGFVVGQSEEIIPTWNRGLGLTLVEPWKIHRDPDALGRDPQSGMYWIHQEFMDYYTLKAAERQGRYINIGDLSNYTTTDEMSEEEQNKRKYLTMTRGKYRNMILVYEFWGTILDKNGRDILFPNGTFTIAGDRVISKPQPSPYPTLRWPGISFSPLPHLLRYDGRGLIESIITLWRFMCSLMCLHNDQMNWVVNPMMEIDISSLVDPMDVDSYPGKHYLTRGTTTGNQVVRPVEMRFRTNEVLANLQYYDRNFQQGTFVTDAVQGLPGYRKDMTWRESAQNLEQGLSVFSLIGKNLEDGALNVLRAVAETILTYMTVADLLQMMSPDDAAPYIDLNSPTGIRLPKLTTGNFHVSGISTMMRNTETMMAIEQNLIPLTKIPEFAVFMHHHNILKAIEKRLNLRDEQILVSDEIASAIRMTAGRPAQNSDISPVPGPTPSPGTAEGLPGTVPPPAPPVVEGGPGGD